MAVRVVNEELTAGHPGRQVPSHRTEHDDRASGHVLARVISHALDHGQRARVPHGEPLARPSGDEQLAARRAVQHGVPGEPRIAGVVGRSGDRDPAAAHPLADVVVGLPRQAQLDAVRQERTERLPRRPVETRADGPGRGSHAERPADRSAQPGPDGAIAVRDGELELHVRAVADRRPRRVEQAIAEHRRGADDGVRGDGAALPERPAQQRLDVEAVGGRVDRRGRGAGRRAR